MGYGIGPAFNHELGGVKIEVSTNDEYPDSYRVAILNAQPRPLVVRFGTWSCVIPSGYTIALDLNGEDI